MSTGAAGRSTRVLLFTGKGGVGKTTTAAATAVHLAAAGQRVLATSADPAHSLADSMDVALGSAPTEVPHSTTSPGSSVMSCDRRDNSVSGSKIMSASG